MKRAVVLALARRDGRRSRGAQPPRSPARRPPHAGALTIPPGLVDLQRLGAEPARAAPVGARDPAAAHGHRDVPGERQVRDAHRARPLRRRRAHLRRLAADRGLPQRPAALVDRRLQRERPGRAHDARRDRPRLRQPPGDPLHLGGRPLPLRQRRAAPDRSRRRHLGPRDQERQPGHRRPRDLPARADRLRRRRQGRDAARRRAASSSTATSPTR